MRSGKRSQTAVSRARGSRGMWPPTYLPRPPVPTMPNDTAELAWEPNGIPGLRIMRLAAAPARACRLVSFATESSLFRWETSLYVRSARNSIPSDGEDEIMRANAPGVVPAVLFVGGDVCDGTRSQFGAAARDGHFHSPFADEDHLFVDMVMRRMRRAAWRQLRLMQLDPPSGVRFAIEHRPELIRPAGLHRDLVEAVGLGRQGGVLRAGLGGCENGEQQAQISARIFHWNPLCHGGILPDFWRSGAPSVSNGRRSFRRVTVPASLHSHPQPRGLIRVFPAKTAVPEQHNLAQDVIAEAPSAEGADTVPLRAARLPVS